jgi:hypothetical protein
MIHNPPVLLGMSETIFRGGKGDFTEGGVRRRREAGARLASRYHPRIVERIRVAV